MCSPALSALYERLRGAASPHSVPGSLPVLFFGDVFTARVVTVGLNPSHQEYVNRNRDELSGVPRRFETLGSLGASQRDTLSDDQCAQAIRTMRGYFQPGRPVYTWFRAPGRVLQGFGVSYQDGEAAHLNLVQESTDPAWSRLHRLDPHEARALLAADLPFLKWQLATFPVEVVVCNGRTVFDEVRRLIDGTVERTGSLKRITWYSGTGNAGGRSVKVAGWNLPLARPTGLSADEQVELGALLAESMSRGT